MLQKCANPSCTTPFRSLREGKLFLSEIHSTDPESPASGARRKPHREHFWLCDACSAHFTLRFDLLRGMMTVPLSERIEPQFLTRPKESKALAKAAC